MRRRPNGFSPRRAGALALAVILTGSLSLPHLSFAKVRVDDTELAQGANAMGGGTATLVDSALDMAGVTAETLTTDEDLTVNFNGGNDIKAVITEGTADVGLNFSGDNEVEEVYATGSSNVTINANGHNEFEEVKAFESSNMMVNVTGENDFEEISGYDDATITVRGTSCQKKDIVNLGKDEDDTDISTDRGALTIDHVTVNLEGEEAYIGSRHGDVLIDTSKVGKGDDNGYARIEAGGMMKVRESVIDITGTVLSKGQMTIKHSDMTVEAPDSRYGDTDPYRIWSASGIELIDEKNGKVLEGEIDGKHVFYVDTDDGDDVDLKADGDPAYYRCAGDRSAGGAPATAIVQALPKTGDDGSPLWPISIALVSAAAIGLAAWHKQIDL